MLDILIVEDDVIIAEDIKFKLSSLGYNVCGTAYSYTEGVEILGRVKPDIALLDVQLSGVKTGIDLASIIKEKLKIPVIFVTANADAFTIAQAKTVEPSGYVVKPFNQRDLYAAIEMATASDPKQLEPKPADNQNDDHLFVKEAHAYTRLKVDSIRWLKAEGNYTKLVAAERPLLVRGKLKEILSQLPINFIRTHNSFAVNLNAIDSVVHSSVMLGEDRIPISDSYRPGLMNQLKII